MTEVWVCLARALQDSWISSGGQEHVPEDKGRGGELRAEGQVKND